MPRPRKIMPPKPVVDWARLSAICRRTWPTQGAMQKQLQFSDATRDAAWNLKPIGLVPVLQICMVSGDDPCNLLVQVKGSPSR